MLIVTCLLPVAKEIILCFSQQNFHFSGFPEFSGFRYLPCVAKFNTVQYFGCFLCFIDSMVTTVKPFEKRYEEKSAESCWECIMTEFFMFVLRGKEI